MYYANDADFDHVNRDEVGVTTLLGDIVASPSRFSLRRTSLSASLV